MTEVLGVNGGNAHNESDYQQYFQIPAVHIYSKDKACCLCNPSSQAAIAAESHRKGHKGT